MALELARTPDKRTGVVQEVQVQDVGELSLEVSGHEGWEAEVTFGHL